MNNLENLELYHFNSNLDTYIDFNGSKTLIDALYDLTSYEISNKNERAQRAWVKVANFPYIKKLDDFDFAFQPSIHK